MRWIGVTMMLLLAGCATPSEPPQEPGGAALSPLSVTQHLVDALPDAVPAAQENGAFTLDHDSVVVFEGDCDPACEPLRFAVPPLDHEAWIDVRVAWDGRVSPGVDMRVAVQGVADEGGHHHGKDGSGPEIRRGFDVVRAVWWEPTSTWHEVHIDGEGPIWGSVRLRSTQVAAVPGGDRLPNMVTLTPLEVGVASCKLDESVEGGAVRCLRLGNAVGNVGDGPLEVHLDHANAALSAAGLGRFVQRIYHDGGHRDVEASGAEFHFTHGHFHYAGLAHFELHPVGPDGVRGDMAAMGHKRGFCFLDWGDMKSPEAPSDSGTRAEQDCLIPKPTGGWSMGITRGWYDYYWSDLADQYIDIEGVPDGVYELVSIADGADTLVETDESDNKASVVIRLQGDRVTVLEERSLYDNPERE